MKPKSRTAARATCGEGASSLCNQITDDSSYSTKKLYTQNDLDQIRSQLHQVLTSNPNLQSQLESAKAHEAEAHSHLGYCRSQLTNAEVTYLQAKDTRINLAEQLRNEAFIAQSR